MPQKSNIFKEKEGNELFLWPSAPNSSILRDSVSFAGGGGRGGQWSELMRHGRTSLLLDETQIGHKISLYWPPVSTKCSLRWLLSRDWNFTLEETNSQRKQVKNNSRWREEVEQKVTIWCCVFAPSLKIWMNEQASEWMNEWMHPGKETCVRAEKHSK